MTRPLLGHLLAELDHRVREAATEDVMRGLASWFGVLPLDEPAFRGRNAPNGALTRYQDVVVDALGVALGQSRGDGLLRGLEWLSERRFFRSDRGGWGLEGDPVSLFVLAVGVGALPAASPFVPWVCNFASRALDVETDSWRRSMLFAAQGTLGMQTWDSVSPELRIALEAKGFGTTSALERDRACAVVLDVMPEMSHERAVVRLAALRRLMLLEGALDVRSAGIDDVATLVRRTTDALKRWPWQSARPRKPAVTWEIASEYDVQALLYGLLRPVFDDLVDEEHLKAIGYKHPRADLAIPRLRLIIEVKFMYETTQSALSKVTEEIAADTGLYLSETNGYDAIIAVIWDQTAATQHHGTLAAGLRKLPGIRDVIIVPRPGTWRSADGGSG